jgi:hypothetical protein
MKIAGREGYTGAAVAGCLPANAVIGKTWDARAGNMRKKGQGVRSRAAAALFQLQSE